jgi:hypothetical protein
MTGPGEADAIAVTGEQYCTNLVLQLFDAPRDAMAGHPQSARRSPETRGARHLKEDADAFPVRNSAISFTSGVLNFVSTDSRI